jgi:hypothetical protein
MQEKATQTDGKTPKAVAAAPFLKNKAKTDWFSFRLVWLMR